MLQYTTTMYPRGATFIPIYVGVKMLPTSVRNDRFSKIFANQSVESKVNLQGFIGRALVHKPY